MSSEKVSSSHGALSSLSTSLLAFRSGFDSSARNVDRSLQSSAHDADQAVSGRRRNLDAAVGERKQADIRMRAAEAELSAAEAELSDALDEDPRYSGNSVGHARARVARAEGELRAASQNLREAEEREREAQRLLERSESARRRIHSALEEYRQSFSSARAAETAIATTALTKLSILKGILGAYLSQSNSSASASRSGAGATHTATSATGDSDGSDASPDWRAHSLHPDTSHLQVATLDKHLLEVLDTNGPAMRETETDDCDMLLTRRWATGGAAMFRRNPAAENFRARDAREGLSGPHSYEAMFERITADPVTVDPKTGTVRSGHRLLRALMDSAAEEIPMRFEGADSDD